MVSSVSPLNKKEPNGIQETNIRLTEPVVVVVVVVVVIQMDFTSALQSQNFKNSTPRFAHIQTLNKPGESCIYSISVDA